MLSKAEVEKARARARELLSRAGIAITGKESASIEVSDLGLGDLERIGLQIITYVNTRRVCAKELIIFPGQICPEHRHPMVEGEPGKEETFRCRWGEVYLYVPGPRTPHPKAKPPGGTKAYYTVWHEKILRPGDQYIVQPDTLHWFQGGPEGAILSEFSTQSRDEFDIFTHPAIQRLPEIEH